ncbi:YihY family inner membrane protein [Histidinibacterium aquaticum]|uniref:UPF0761 membrane protein F3S47_11550 n=1 Tax=Histidinibacterium aquaticum TaxID=2613962 RepID=A0A5J5GIQ5_9RHOB|nr:YihY family inner membrane protein [Histidinibacterium aquaticum]KAA9008129.1 YihY family inner membrane protein [Histidinibacterium aquaticum]
MKAPGDVFSHLRKSGTALRSGRLYRFLQYSTQRFFADRIDHAVAALTFATLLAIVPLLVISFAVMSYFEAFETAKVRMESLVFEAIVPEAGATLREYLTGFTQNAGELTTLGVIGLAITAILLLSTIEATLNQIWRVERTRPVIVRFIVFWTVLTLGPLLVAVSLTLTSDVLDFANRLEPEDLGVTQRVPSFTDWQIVQTAGRVMLSTFGLTAMFVIVPARLVLVRHAVVGAFLAALCFEALAWAFNAYLFSSSTYRTIYGAVAAVPIFLLWIYSSWVVIALGAIVAASIPDWRHEYGAPPGRDQTSGERLVAAVTLLANLHRKAQEGGMLTEADLIESTGLGRRSEVFEMLASRSYVLETEAGGVALLRDLHSLTLYELAKDVGAVVGQELDPNPVIDQCEPREITRIKQLLGRLMGAERDILGVSVASLLETEDGMSSVIRVDPQRSS